jgi:methionyl-tRNA formyltransferase
MRDQENLPTPPKPITLFLMTEKGYAFLMETSKKYKSLFNLVVVGSDKTLQKDFEEEIINLCIQENINHVRKADFIDIKSEYAMAISWRWLINHPADKLIVFHDSLLPKYRGFAPLVNSLINGETEIGVTAIFGANDFDTGDIIAQSKSQITYPLTIAEAIQINNQNYLKCGDLVLSQLLRGQSITATKQDENEATYSVWRDEEDFKIDWQKSAGEIRRFIDALGFPYKGASTTFDGKFIRIFKVEECEDVTVENRDCGKVLFVREGKPVVICGRGMIKIVEAQIEENGKIIPFFPLAKFRLRFV